VTEEEMKFWPGYVTAVARDRDMYLRGFLLRLRRVKILQWNYGLLH